MKLDQGITNFKAYEGANDFYGMVDATLPDISLQGDDVTGAGIAGAVAAKYGGHVEAMTLALNFRSVQKHLISLVEDRKHTITLLGDQAIRDNDSGLLTHQGVKYVLSGIPTKFSPGKLAPASAADSNIEFSITYFAGFLDGKKLFEVDQLNFIYYINGVDYLAAVRKNLGMN